VRNQAQRWREVLQVVKRVEVVRDWMPPDWQEWAYCPGCQADRGQPCYDLLGSARAFRATDRLNPHPERLPVGALDDEEAG
jgi:hypothetical protein